MSALKIQEVLLQDEHSDDDDFGNDPFNDMREEKRKSDLQVKSELQSYKDPPVRRGDVSEVYSAWTETEDIPYIRKIKMKEDPEIELFKNDEISDLLADRNYECLMDYEREDKKLDYWQEQRLKEEEDIKSINFEQYVSR